MDQINHDINRYLSTSTVGVFILTALGIVDSVIAGHIIGEKALVTTGLAGPVFLIIN